MVEITAKQILQMAPRAKEVETLAQCINQWAPVFLITSPLRMAHFLAQCAHETAGFTLLTEKASGAAYEWNRILGNTQKGDGPRFKGRGLMQLTSRANYHAYAQSPWCKGDLMSHPEWLAKYPGAVKSAMWYWWSRGLNAYADIGAIKTITYRINGGYNGLESRKKYYELAAQALNIK